MKKDVALARYLERHIEPKLPDSPGELERWQSVLVIPAYDEHPELLERLSKLENSGAVLVILVLNRPDSDLDTRVNSALRDSVNRLPKIAERRTTISRLSHSVDLFLYDLEQRCGSSPAAQGVGLARKVGCDIALLWQSQGAISGEWIHCSDADALLPPDYFFRTENLAAAATAVVYPFFHARGKTDAITRATALYELRLHYYVLGLRYAGSPYAYHTMGSCIAFKSQSYAQVRGYPKRSGGEDFYLLNKLAKTGPVISLTGQCIALQSRASSRVPFGTGPATGKIIRDQLGQNSLLFYHPVCFEALRVFLSVVDDLQNAPLSDLQQLLTQGGLASDLASLAQGALAEMGLAGAIEHCRQHGKSAEQYLRHFYQWFDGFRTLKFIHAMRDGGWPMQSLAGLAGLQPQLLPLPVDAPADTETIRGSIRDQWHWAISSEEAEATPRRKNIKVNVASASPIQSLRYE